MITSIESFISYFDGIRRRTIIFCRTLPAERMDWAPQAGEFTCGDIIRHLAASEQMFSGLAVDDRWQYGGHQRDLAPELPAALALLDATHVAATARLRTLDDAALNHDRAPLGGQGRPLKVGRVLLLLAEHEIHHRSQLATYLTLMGAEAPQIYGMKLEDVVAIADV